MVIRTWICWTFLSVLFIILKPSLSFLSRTTLLPPSHRQISLTRSDSSPNNEDALPDYELPEEKAERLRQQAENIRRQAEELENSLRRKPPPRETYVPRTTKATVLDDGSGPPTLRNKRILVAGANGRLGSMVCRYLLRNYPEIKEVVALVHTVGEASSRGYGRLSYEVGAEDGRGTIGPAWDGETRRASFTYDGEVMQGYNLNKLRIVPCELLDPVQCRTVCEDVDSVIYCATDFNGNAPRALGLNVAFLFRALASPTKGRVEIEGLENMLGAIKLAKDNRRKENDPIEFLLVSMDPTAYGDFETPFGEFNALKRQAEQMLQQYPSVTSAVLQMGRYEDNFVDEGLDILVARDGKEDETTGQKQINRRDAAKAAVEALVKKDTVGNIVRIYSTIR